jgi:hypothetical protein
VRLLLDAGVDPSGAAIDENSPLMTSAQEGHVEERKTCGLGKGAP